MIDGELVTRHCTSSSSATHHGDAWVVMELEVRGADAVRHLVGGAVVLEYSEPQLDEGDADALRLLALGAPKRLAKGYVALQAESHPLEFRRVELLPLD